MTPTKWKWLRHSLSFAIIAGFILALLQPASANAAPVITPATVSQAVNESVSTVNTANLKAIDAAKAALNAAAVADTTQAAIQQQAYSQLAMTADYVAFVSTYATLTSYTGLCQGGIRAGPGLTLGRDKVVLYMCLYNGHDYALLCPDPLKPASNPASVGTAYSISGATNFAAAAYIAWNYARYSDGGGSKRYDNNWGAATRLSFWLYTGQATRAKADLVYANATVKSLYATMTANAVKFAGPYKVTQISKTYPQLNTVGSTKFRITSAKGYGMAGVTFTWKVTTSNATLVTPSTKSDVNGYFTVSYKPTKFGVVSASATSSALAANAVRYWVPVYSTYQRFYSGLSTTVKAAFSTTIAPAVVGLKYSCVGVCAPVPVTTTAPVCNKFNAQTQVLLNDNGAWRSEVKDIPIGTCATPSWLVDDTHTVFMRLRVLINGAWVNYDFAKIVVDCPPWPTLHFESTTNCDGRVIHINVAANPNHAVSLIKNGQRLTAPAGQSISYYTTAPCTTALDFIIQSGVQRNNGAWNDSPLEKHSFALAA